MNQFIYKNNNSDLSKTVWQLYESAFPIYERRSLKLHLKAMQDNRFYPYVYTSEQSKLLAICFYWDFADFKYLEHFAVHPHYRNQGIGSKIIQTLNIGKQPIILEIEPPIDTLTQQRLNFYEQNQFKYTGYQFTQLKYRRKANNVQLELLCNKEMSLNLYKKFKTIIYKELTLYNEH